MLISEILKDAPYGTKLYSTAWGDVTLCHVDIENNIHVLVDSMEIVFDGNGRLYLTCDDLSDVCMLYPSRGNMTWDNWRDILFTNGCHVKDSETGNVYEFLSYDDNGIANVIEHYENGNLKRLCVFTKYLSFAPSHEESTHVAMFDKTTLKPFDKVIVRDEYDDEWVVSLFSHISKHHGSLKYFTIGCQSNGYEQCVPFNEETEHLIGTDIDAPEKYRS